MSLIVSKSDALALRQTLVPSPNTLSAWNPFLLWNSKNDPCNGGMLENGIQFNIRENTATSSSVLLDEEKFNELISKVCKFYGSWGRINLDESARTCRDIFFCLKELIVIISSRLLPFEEDISRIESRILKYVETHSALCRRKKEMQNQLLQQTAKIAGLEKREAELPKEIDAVESKLKNIEEMIQKAKTERTDAIVDSIPIVGQVVGLVGGVVTRRYTRMIPFYSGIKGLISVFSQNRENLETELALKKREIVLLKQEKDFAKKEQDREKIALDDINRQIAAMETQSEKLDEKTKPLGKKITRLRNVKLSSENLLAKYKFLSDDVNLISEFLQINLLDGTLILNLFEDLSRIQRKYFLIDDGNP